MTDINFGAITETINNKADIDAQNFDATGKSYLAGLSFPSDNYVDLTLGASGAIYTAPADGYIRFDWNSGAGTSYITIIQSIMIDQVVYNAQYTNLSKVFIVRKGDFIINYANVTFSAFRFVYARGNV